MNLQEKIQTLQALREGYIRELAELSDRYMKFIVDITQNEEDAAKEKK